MTTVTAEPDWDLTKLNTFIGQMENAFVGPLTKIGNDGNKTTLAIDSLGGKPAKHSLVTTDDVPDGGTKINTDKIFISGELKNATAYKPKP